MELVLKTASMLESHNNISPDGSILGILGELAGHVFAEEANSVSALHSITSYYRYKGRLPLHHPGPWVAFKPSNDPFLQQLNIFVQYL
jgi:hypothetical protein